MMVGASFVCLRAHCGIKFALERLLRRQGPRGPSSASQWQWHDCKRAFWRDKTPSPIRCSGVAAPANSQHVPAETLLASQARRAFALRFRFLLLAHNADQILFRFAFFPGIGPRVTAQPGLFEPSILYRVFCSNHDFLSTRDFVQLSLSRATRS